MHAFKSVHHDKVLSHHMPLFFVLFEYFSGSIFLIISDFRAVGSFHIRWTLRVRFLKNPALPHFQLIFYMQSYPDNPIAFAQSTWQGLVWSAKTFSSTRKVGKGEMLPLKCSSEYKIFTLEFASVLCWLIFHEQSPSPKESPIFSFSSTFLCQFIPFQWHKDMNK